jgi:endogenous inhibitor of DNA gyrase (YacG/DUF329 family)
VGGVGDDGLWRLWDSMEKRREWRDGAWRKCQRNEQESNSVPVGLDLLCWAMNQANIRVEEESEKGDGEGGEQEEEDEERRETNRDLLRWAMDETSIKEEEEREKEDGEDDEGRRKRNKKKGRMDDCRCM